MTVEECVKLINKKYGKKIIVRGDELLPKKPNPRYKKLTKLDLLNNDIAVIIDGEFTNYMSLKELNEKHGNYKTFEIFQYSYKYNRWLPKQAVRNTIRHDKGINKECSYYQVPVRFYGKPASIPLHRFIYVWFKGEINPYNEHGELMDICHVDRDSSNNHITNLKWDTRKNNLAERTGATNQWGKTKNGLL